MPVFMRREEKKNRQIYKEETNGDDSQSNIRWKSLHNFQEALLAKRYLLIRNIIKQQARQCTAKKKKYNCINNLLLLCFVNFFFLILCFNFFFSLPFVLSIILSQYVCSNMQWFKLCVNKTFIHLVKKISLNSQ